jgi:hypothetical protein
MWRSLEGICLAITSSSALQENNEVEEIWKIQPGSSRGKYHRGDQYIYFKSINQDEMQGCSAIMISEQPSTRYSLLRPTLQMQNIPEIKPHRGLDSKVGN